MNIKRGFASDNNAGVHPRVMDALRSAGRGHVLAYGNDPYTETAFTKFREQFGASAEVFFVFGGTGANVLALASVTRPHEAVVCASTGNTARISESPVWCRQTPGIDQIFAKRRGRSV